MAAAEIAARAEAQLEAVLEMGQGVGVEALRRLFLRRGDLREQWERVASRERDSFLSAVEIGTASDDLEIAEIEEEKEEKVHDDDVGDGRGAGRKGGREGATAAQAHLAEVLARAGNTKCADCGAPQPTWASKNLGVFLCTHCAGVHRTLGVHISCVASTVLDDWSTRDVGYMAVRGNLRVNARLEYHVPGSAGKPAAEAPRQEREAYIRDKYEHLCFAVKLPLPAGAKRRRPPTYRAPPVPSAIPRPPFQASSPAMVEYLGFLTIRVVRASDLLNMGLREKRNGRRSLGESGIGGGFSSQVRLSLGNQEVRTRLVRGGTQPVFDEELRLCWDGKAHLSVDVFTRDQEHVGAGSLNLGFLQEPRKLDICHEVEAEAEAEAEAGVISHVSAPMDGDIMSPMSEAEVVGANSSLESSSLWNALGGVQHVEGDKIYVELHHRNNTMRERRGPGGIAQARAGFKKLARGSFFFGSRQPQGGVVLGIEFHPIDH